MFVSQKGLIRLMKSAYRNMGLRLRNQDDVIEIRGSYWRMTIDRKLIPKEVMGAIIMLTGTLPDDGEAFCATKEGNQQEFWPADYESALTLAQREGNPVYISGVVLLDMSTLRVLQSGDRTLTVLNSIISIVSPALADTEHGEDFPEVPKQIIGEAVCWSNNWMAFAIQPTYPVKMKKVLECLGTMDLESMEDDDNEHD